MIAVSAPNVIAVSGPDSIPRHAEHSLTEFQEAVTILLTFLKFPLLYYAEVRPLAIAMDPFYRDLQHLSSHRGGHYEAGWAMRTAWPCLGMLYVDGKRLRCNIHGNDNGDYTV